MNRDQLQEELNGVLSGIKEELDRGRNLSSRVEHLDGQYTEIKGALEALDAKMGQLSQPAPQKRPFTSTAQAVADTVLNTKGIQDFVNRTPGSGVDFQNFQVATDFYTPFSTKAAVGGTDYLYDTSASRRNDVRTILSVENERLIDRADLRMPSIWDVIRKRPTDQKFIQWVGETGRTYGAAGVAEGATKPSSSFVLGNNLSEAVTMAHHITTSLQAIQDMDELEEFIRDFLVHGLEMHIESQLMTGNGNVSSGNLQGLMTNPGISYQAFTTNVYDSVRHGINLLRKADRMEPTALIVNHDDHLTMDVLKAGDGHYLWTDSGRNALGSEANSLWRLPLIPTNAIWSGTSLLGDFQRGCEIREKSPMSISFSYENSTNFVQNLVTVLIECQLHFITKRPNRFVKIGMASGY